MFYKSSYQVSISTRHQLCFQFQWFFWQSIKTLIFDMSLIWSTRLDQSQRAGIKYLQRLLSAPIWEGEISNFQQCCPIWEGEIDNFQHGSSQSPLPSPGSPPWGRPMVGALPSSFCQTRPKVPCAFHCLYLLKAPGIHLSKWRHTYCLAKKLSIIYHDDKIKLLELKL